MEVNLNLSDHVNRLAIQERLAKNPLFGSLSRRAYLLWCVILVVTFISQPYDERSLSERRAPIMIRWKYGHHTPLQSNAE